MRTKSYRYLDSQWSEEFDPTLDSVNTMILVFFESSLAIDAHLKKIKATYPNSKILGASTSGEILGSTVYDNSIICTIVQFQNTELKLFSTPVDYETSKQAGRRIGENLAAVNLKNILLFTEGINIDGPDFIKELHNSLQEKDIHAPVNGGLAGDGHRLVNTFVICDTEAKTNHAVAIGLYGENINTFSGIGTGWDPFGPPRVVTKAYRNTVYEIDGKPALELYKEYLKDEAKNIPVSGSHFPMGISWGEKENIVRSVSYIDEANNGLIFACKISEKTNVQMMHSNVIKLIDASKKTLDHCTLNLANNTPTLALIISCLGRRIIMGQKTEDEIEIIKQQLPSNAEICGFYSYGEYAPTKMNRNEVHNQTMTLILLQERPV